MKKMYTLLTALVFVSLLFCAPVMAQNSGSRTQSKSQTRSRSLTQSGTITRTRTRISEPSGTINRYMGTNPGEATGEAKQKKTQSGQQTEE